MADFVVQLGGVNFTFDVMGAHGLCVRTLPKVYKGVRGVVVGAV